MGGLSGLLQSFSEAVAPFIDFLIWVFPLKIYKLHDGELGIITTLGKVRRKKAERKPGITFCFMFEEMDVAQALGGYIDLSEQAIRTKDNKVAIMDGAVEYRITNVKDALLKADEIEELIEGNCLNEMREYARTRNLEELLDSSRLTSGLAAKINKKIERHGAIIERCMITDLRPHEVTMICDTIREVLKGADIKPETLEELITRLRGCKVDEVKILHKNKGNEDK